MPLSIFALMFTCFVDVMGQGLAFPIFAALLIQPNGGFIQGTNAPSNGAILYGIAIGTFFLTWFFWIAVYLKTVRQYWAKVGHSYLPVRRYRRVCNRNSGNYFSQLCTFSDFKGDHWFYSWSPAYRCSSDDRSGKQ